MQLRAIYPLFGIDMFTLNHYLAHTAVSWKCLNFGGYQAVKLKLMNKAQHNV